jgi:hypothetical protein
MTLFLASIMQEVMLLLRSFCFSLFAVSDFVKFDSVFEKGFMRGSGKEFEPAVGPSDIYNNFYAAIPFCE